MSDEHNVIAKRTGRISDEMIYVKISLREGGTYIQPLNQLNVLVEEIALCADYEEVGAHWDIDLIEMPEEEYNKLPDFTGH